MNTPTKSQHTPGPWKQEPHDDHIMITDGPTGMAAIARIGRRQSWDKERREVVAANARLIAAAPDLLAALEALLDMATDNRTHGPEIDRACAALTKARA